MTLPGEPGHGSRLDIAGTAGPKLTRLLADVDEFRERQRLRLLEGGGALQLGDVTSINLTKVVTTTFIFESVTGRTGT